MKADNIYTKAALAGYIDEDTNTVTAEMISYYLDDLKWEFIEYMDHNCDYRPTLDVALDALQEFEGDFEQAADWIMADVDTIDYKADAMRTYWHMAMRS